MCSNSQKTFASFAMHFPQILFVSIEFKFGSAEMALLYLNEVCAPVLQQSQKSALAVALGLYAIIPNLVGIIFSSVGWRDSMSK